MVLNNLIPKEWGELIDSIWHTDKIKELQSFLDDAYTKSKVYPTEENIFNAFQYFLPQDTKVVILGQDPYHGEGEAHGLAFSVPHNIRIPPSLKNIFTELHNDLGVIPPPHGNLTEWAKQGVLLLNTVLSVEKDKAGSHQNKGWEILTDELILQLSSKNENIVFILWGNHAQHKRKLINENSHFVISSAHPSPLSAYRGFFGSNPFSKTNTFLKEKNREPIDWVKQMNVKR